MKNGKKPKSISVLFIGFQNIERLKNKETDVRDLLAGKIKGVKTPHVYGLAEHWGNQDIQDMATHKWFGLDKPTHDGMYGGVGAYVANKLSPFTQILHEFSNPNVMWLRIITMDEPIFVAVVYAPPKETTTLEEIINNLISTKASLSGLGRVLIMGDFNCRLGALTRDKKTNTRGKLLKDFFKSTKSSPLSNKQSDHWTCYTWNGESVSDLFIVDNKDKIKCKDYRVFKDVRFSSAHALLTFRWNILVQPPDKLQWSDNLSNQIDWDDDQLVLKYQNLLTPGLTQWANRNNVINSIGDSNRASSKLVSLIKDSLCQIQTQTKKSQTLHTEHNSAEIRNLRRERNDNIASFSAESTSHTRKQLLSKITTLQNKISIATETLEKKKVRKLWDKVLETKKEKNSTTYWKMIKAIRKPREKLYPMAILGPNGTLLTTKEEILRAFSNRYKHVFEASDKEAADYQKFLSQQEPAPSTNKARKSISKKYENVRSNFKPNNQSTDPETSIFDIDLDIEETENAIAAFNLHKATGKSQIPAEALQKGGDLLTKCLHKLYSAWWKQGTTPQSMQEAMVTPLYKKKDVTLTQNYRPISLLNSIFKTYEKILETRLRAFVEDNNCITPLQMGARANTGTTEAIFQLLSATTSNTNNKQPVYLTLLDLSKAFDRVWRKGLWVKLHSIGIKGNLLRAIHSTYSNPKFTVKIGDSTSETLPCVNGLRQGSVLSPLLFIILFSDVAETLYKDRGIAASNTNNKLLHCQMFVDDTILLTNNEEDIKTQFGRFNKFARLWGSVLNVDKTMILSTDKIKNDGQWLLETGMEDAPTNLAKYLGLWISLDNSTWNQHFAKTISSAKKSFFYLHAKGLKKGHIEPSEALTLFKLLIIPKLTYCAEVIIPSEAVISKVNNFFALAVKHMLGIPMSAPTQSVLWEADITDFSLQLEMAKLRFHRKMVVNNPHISVSTLYCKGNYLFDSNQALLEKWDPTLTYHSSTWKNLFSTPNSPSKTTWKNLLKKALQTRRISLFKTKLPSFYNIKPIPEIYTTLLKLPLTSQVTMFRARHCIAPLSHCPVCKPSGIYSSSKHYLTECTRPDVLASRIGLSMGIDSTTDLDTSNLSPNQLHDVLLGKPLDSTHTGISQQLLGAVADHLQTFTPQDEFEFSWC